MFEPDQQTHPPQAAAAPLKRLIRQIDGVLHRCGSRVLRPAEVHDLRVAIARLRVALSVFRQPVGRRRRRKLDRALRRVRRALGPVRDLDVLQTHLLARGRQTQLVAALLRVAARQRRQALGEARVVLHGELDAGLGLRLRKARQRLKRRIARGGFGRIERESLDGLDRRLERIRDQVGSLVDGDPEALHRLRMDVKKLRYALELRAERIPKEALQPCLDTLADIQNHLGEAHDAVVRQAQLADLRAAAGAGGRALRGPHPGARPKTALSARVARSLDALRRLQPVWAAAH